MRDRDMAEAMQAVRGDAYRDQLDHISPAVWAWCVDEAIAMLDWFPTVRELLDLAARAPRSPTPSRALLPPGDRDAIDAYRRACSVAWLPRRRARRGPADGGGPIAEPARWLGYRDPKSPEALAALGLSISQSLLGGLVTETNHSLSTPCRGTPLSQSLLGGLVTETPHDDGTPPHATESQSLTRPGLRNATTQPSSRTDARSRSWTTPDG